MTNQIFKRLMTLSVLAIATIFSLSNQAKAVELLKNGGCEVGGIAETPTFWTGSNTSIPTINLTRASKSGQEPIGDLAYISPTHSQEGNRSCFMGLISYNAAVGNVNTIRLYQDIVVPTGMNLTISWKQKFSQQNLTNPNTTPIFLRVRILTPSDAVLGVLYAKDLAAQTNEVLPWETRTVNLGNTYAGQTIRLEFIGFVTDTNAPNYTSSRALWEFDDISANALPPTAASVPVSGRVMNAEGRPISGAIVRIMDINGSVQSAYTNQFGQYRFSVEAGNVYAVEARAKGIQFINNPRIITVLDEVAEEDFRADGASIQKIE